MKKRKVYITNLSVHDYSKAEKYGELVPLTSGTVDVKNIDRLILNICEKLKDSNKEDFVLLSGHPSTVAVAIAIMLHLHNKVKILIWDWNREEYSMRTISNRKINKALEILKRRK